MRKHANGMQKTRIAAPCSTGSNALTTKREDAAEQKAARLHARFLYGWRHDKGFVRLDSAALLWKRKPCKQPYCISNMRVWHMVYVRAAYATRMHGKRHAPLNNHCFIAKTAQAATLIRPSLSRTKPTPSGKRYYKFTVSPFLRLPANGQQA